MSKFFIFIAVTALLGWGIFGLTLERFSMSKEIDSLREEYESLRDENLSFVDSIHRLSYAANILKEVKSQFHFRSPDERLIVIVPQASTSTSASSTRR